MSDDIRAARQCKQELAMARGLQDPRNLLPVQILVLLSLGQQVILFLCAGVRRRETSSSVPVRVLLLWLAYNFGDTFATYTLGHLSFFSSTGDHQLVALWAPFLLLHLAGPDNIAAYALQDNQLSLRSLQKVFVQVAAGGYFLYSYKNSSGDILGPAPRLMFIVGVLKYGERWLALQSGTLGSIGDSLKKQRPVMYSHVHKQDVKLMEMEGLETLDDESSVRRAHSLFHICKCAMVDSSEDEQGRHNIEKKLEGVEFWTIIEIELSLMYDILYTKAAVIHTWHGYGIRVMSLLGILISLLLFHFSGEDGHGQVNTALTYVLFGSALFMEWASLLNMLGSSWMFNTLSTTRSTWLRYKLLCSGRWDRLRRLVVSVNSLGVTRGAARRWSGNMGQYNILHFCTRPNTLLTRPLLSRLAKLVGLEELWNRKHFSGAINISDHASTIKVYINNHTRFLYMQGELNTLGMIKRQWGMTTLVRHNLQDDFEEKLLGSEFQEGIIIWHIGTDFFLSKCKSANALLGLVNAIKALSNYMMFLLVERSYMLPGIAQNRLYQRTCKALDQGVSHYHARSICAVLKSLFSWRDDPAGYTSMATHSRTHAEKLYNKYVGHEKFTYDTVRLNYSATVAEKLLLHEGKHGTRKSLELLLELWADMLVYAGNKCSRESHAKKLGSGGELTTIVWLMVEHFHQAGLVYDGNQASAKVASSKEDYQHNFYRV